jgi:DNA-binding CsgD family transcriptional regulator/tetratricopeptide (TPR) repeat protein
MTGGAGRTTGSRLSPILVGRDGDLQRVERLLESVAAGDGTFLLLGGEAGIGKTRLLGAIERKAAAIGFRHVRGQSFPEDREVAAAPFIDLAGAMVRTEAFANLGAAMLARLRTIEPDTSADGARRRRQMVLDVVDLLASAASAPTLIAIENLTDVDDLSLEILARLARRLRDLPMIVVGTYRSDELYPRAPVREWRSRLVTGRFAEVIQLTRLSLADTATMAGLILGQEQPPPSDMVEALYERTDGNPLHVEELLGVVLEQHRSGRDAVRAADVPDTLDAAIRQRMDGLSDSAQALIGVASVIGHDFGIDLLAVLTGETVDVVWPALDELIGRFFLAAAAAPDRYEFRHGLIRDVVYRSVALPERPRLHSRVADLLADRGDASDALLSYHYELAGRRDEAFRSALAGAGAAAAISSHREAFELYRRALRSLPAELPAVEHADMLAAFAIEAGASDDNVTAAEAYASARERYLVGGAVRDAAALQGPIAATRHLLGDSLDSRVALLRQGLSELEDAPVGPATDRVRGRLLANLGGTLMYDLRLVESMDYAAEARRIAADVDDQPTESHAATTLANDLLFSGRTTEGWELASATIRRARAAQLEAEASRAYRIMGATGSEVIDYERGELFFREGIEYTERVERWNDRHYMSAHLGLVLWAVGRWDEGWRLAEQALVDGQPGITTRITALYVLGYIALGRGNWERARELLGGSLELGEPMGEILRTSLSVWGLAETELLAGVPASAITWAERGVADSERVGDAALLFPFLVTGTRAFLAAGDPGAAKRWIDRLEPSLRRARILGTLPAIDHGRGLVLAAGGSTGQARTALETSIRGWDEAGRVWEGTWARLDLAAVLLRINRVADAIALVEDVRSIGDRLGSRPLADAAATLLASARARHPSEEPWHPLTAREFEVARLIAAGLTNAEIAGQLHIAPKTASSHVEHILDKLGVARRAEIAAWTSMITRRG